MASRAADVIAPCRLAANCAALPDDCVTADRRFAVAVRIAGTSKSMSRPTRSGFAA
jgi:hypothetical protein